MNICTECKHCRDHLVKMFNRRREERLKREQLHTDTIESVCQEESVKNYLCDHPYVVDVNPVDGTTTLVRCHMARGTEGACGRHGAYWEKKESDEA
jgi:fructose-1,6-bisphosphatase/inositol monophosphatase family enzyme